MCTITWSPVSVQILPMEHEFHTISLGKHSEIHVIIGYVPRETSSLVEKPAPFLLLYSYTSSWSFVIVRMCLSTTISARNEEALNK